MRSYDKQRGITRRYFHSDIKSSQSLFTTRKRATSIIILHLCIEIIILLEFSTSSCSFTPTSTTTCTTTTTAFCPATTAHLSRISLSTCTLSSRKRTNNIVQITLLKRENHSSKSILFARNCCYHGRHILQNSLITTSTITKLPPPFPRNSYTKINMSRKDIKNSINDESIKQHQEQSTNESPIDYQLRKFFSGKMVKHSLLSQQSSNSTSKNNATTTTTTSMTEEKTQLDSAYLEDSDGNRSTLCTEEIERIPDSSQSSCDIRMVDKPFSVAQQTVQSFLSRQAKIFNQEFQDAELTLPLLKRIWDSQEKNGDNDSQYDEVESLFNILFQPNTNIYPPSPTDSKSSTVTNEVIPYLRSKKGRGKQHFKVHIAYHGQSFCGWQLQPRNDQLPSVQQTVISILDSFLSPFQQHESALLGDQAEQDILNELLLRKNDIGITPRLPTPLEEIDNYSTSEIDTITKSKKSQKKVKNRQPQLDVRVCGRTDAGVSALSQVCRVRTLRPPDEVSSNDIQCWINRMAIELSSCTNNHANENNIQPSFWCTSVETVNQSFHPTFLCQARAYAYLIDTQDIHEVFTALNDEVYGTTNKQVIVSENKREKSTQEHNLHCIKVDDIVFVSMVNIMLQQLEGLTLDYYALSYGKVKTNTTLCTLMKARASLVTTSISKKEHSKAICIELVGDRFLRRMVRILVATVFREVIDTIMTSSLLEVHNEGKPETYQRLYLNQGQVKDINDVLSSIMEDWKDRLKILVQEGSREKSAKAAPGDGLIFLGALFP